MTALDNLKIKYVPCRGCGARIRDFNSIGLCTKCRNRADQKSPRTDKRVGGRTRRSGRMGKCRICGKKFECAGYQEPRFTWYCHDCRPKIRAITDGVQWQARMGVSLALGKATDPLTTDDFEDDRLIKEAERERQG